MNTIIKFLRKCFTPKKKAADWLIVVGWWRAQYPRWRMEDGSINSNAYQWILNGELKRNVAPFLQTLFPSSTFCRHCHWPSWLVKDHTVMMNDHSGVNAVCEACWSHLMQYGRKDIIRKCFHENRIAYWPNISEVELDAALEGELGPFEPISFHMVCPED